MASPLTIASVFLWIGFVCAISFMEAWLKFRAPGITLPLGLGIGRLVFRALNRMEWLFSIAVAAGIYMEDGSFLSQDRITYYAAVLILILQTAWLLPALDKRAEMHIKGEKVPPSKIHFAYVAMELVKVVCLFVFGSRLF